MTHIQKKSGFTIVELLIVIVVIAILAAIVAVTFNGIQKRSIETGLVSDLHNAATQLGIDKASSGVYPDSVANANGSKGLTSSATTAYQYTSDDDSFCLTATSTKGNTDTYYISSSVTSPTKGLCPGHTNSSGGGSVPAGYESAPIASGGSSDIGGYKAIQPSSCPSNGGAWVKVPGNSLYGTDNGFCVQQYPASNVGGVATSQQSGNRWTALGRPAAETAANAIDTGTHLQQEKEWMTIAANAAMQAANWSGGSVNSGSLPTGSSSSSRGSMSVVLSNGERVYFDTGASSYNAYVEFTCYTGADSSGCGLAAQNLPSPANVYYTDQLDSLISNFNSLESKDGKYYGDPRFANPSLQASVNSSRNTGTGYFRTNYASGSSTVYNSTRGFWNGAKTSGLFTLQFFTTESYAHATYGFRAAK